VSSAWLQATANKLQEQLLLLWEFEDRKLVSEPNEKAKSAGRRGEQRHREERTQPYDEAANAPPNTPPKLLPQVTTQFTMPSKRPLRCMGALSMRRTLVVVNNPAPVSVLPIMNTAVDGARPARSCPIAKLTEAAKKTVVGWKIVLRRPTSGVVHELAICRAFILNVGQQRKLRCTQGTYHVAGYHPRRRIVVGL
jgi:hypothetical protein